MFHFFVPEHHFHVTSGAQETRAVIHLTITKNVVTGTGGEHLYHVALYRDVASGIFYWGDGSRLLASLYAKLRQHDIRNTTKNCGYVVISRTAAMQFAIEDCDGVSSGFICQRIASELVCDRILVYKSKPNNQQKHVEPQ